MISLIPIHDENPTRRTAVVTYTLIAVNFVVFLLEPASHSLFGQSNDAAAQCQQLAFFYKWAAIPRELVTNHQLSLTAGPPVDPTHCTAVAPNYDKIPFLSVLTAMFLHGGWLHILGNMLFLYVFGNNVEDRLGRLRYLFFYLLCGYVATYGFALTEHARDRSGRPDQGLAAGSCSAPGSSCSTSTSRARASPRAPT